jgi:hypothetical protein
MGHRGASPGVDRELVIGQLASRELGLKYLSSLHGATLPGRRAGEHDRRLYIVTPSTLM